ncbi:MAG TPA: TlpA disulfide reductase family protein [Chitinophagales bacterium]|nr:TlpA family protein disulfide reductase [Chitinophagales bacterium]HMU68490.1 TlpA disulfide reductase family protein [Chitinophagales bacterium]HMX04013.1 TlpA disulfide reductase family protein [Chitinophagales bacterium]HMZ88364.1 TlpA disulfide reductase family protein [Chitinophagales bacterium]HNA58299.1 TlpA disulfide reductase family protein [Chitinophagales bacterium]
MKKFVLLSATLFAAITMVNAQDKLPSLELSDVNGNKINVADYSNDSTIQVFSFWATWCVPCKEELNNIAEIYEDWQKDYKVEIIAVSIDDAKTKANAKSYAEGQGWTYTVLLDTNKDLQRLLGGQSVPFTVITDKSGNIVDKHTGYIEGDEYELEDKIAKLAKE